MLEAEPELQRAGRESQCPREVRTQGQVQHESAHANVESGLGAQRRADSEDTESILQQEPRLLKQSDPGIAVNEQYET